MPLSDLIMPEGILPSLKASTKKQALQEVSERAATLTGLSAREIARRKYDKRKRGGAA